MLGTPYFTHVHGGSTPELNALVMEMLAIKRHVVLPADCQADFANPGIRRTIHLAWRGGKNARKKGLLPLRENWRSYSIVSG